MLLSLPLISSQCSLNLFHSILNNSNSSCLQVLGIRKGRLWGAILNFACCKDDREFPLSSWLFQNFSFSSVHTTNGHCPWLLTYIRCIWSWAYPGDYPLGQYFKKNHWIAHHIIVFLKRSLHVKQFRSFFPPMYLDISFHHLVWHFGFILIIKFTPTVFIFF